MDSREKFVPVAREHRHLPDETGCLWSGLRAFNWVVMYLLVCSLLIVNFDKIVAYWQGWFQSIFGA